MKPFNVWITAVTPNNSSQLEANCDIIQRRAEENPLTQNWEIFKTAAALTDI